MPYAVIFPGQGAAVPAAGEPWRERASWSVVEEAEDVLERPLGRLLLEADAAELGTTRASQLAVLLTSLVAWDALAARLDERPRAFAGHSLGQITALLVSEGVERSDGLRLAARRADLSQASADANPGRMAALVGADMEVAERACEGLDAWVANDNAPGQVVIAGTPEGLDLAAERATELGVRRVRRLEVGHAFHTPLLAGAADALRPLLDTLRWRPPTAPVVSNTDAVAYDGDEGWPERLSRHLIEPVRWRECQHTLAALGIDILVEVGPGKVLAGLARRTLPEIEVVNVATPGDVDTALERLAAGARAGAGDDGQEADEQGRAHRDRDDGHPDRAVVVAAAAARHSASGPDLPPTEDPL